MKVKNLLCKTCQSWWFIFFFCFFCYDPFSFSWAQVILGCEQYLKAAVTLNLAEHKADPTAACLAWGSSAITESQNGRGWKILIREAQVEQVTQKLELALFRCNSVVSDYSVRVMSWNIKKELYIHCISYYLCPMFWSEVVLSGWPPWRAAGATPGNGFLKKWLSQLMRNWGWGGEICRSMTDSGSDWIDCSGIDGYHV